MGLKRNIAHLLGYQVLTWLVTFLFLIYTPRELGSDAMGAIGYAVRVRRLLHVGGGTRDEHGPGP